MRFIGKVFWCNQIILTSCNAISLWLLCHFHSISFFRWFHLLQPFSSLFGGCAPSYLLDDWRVTNSPMNEKLHHNGNARVNRHIYWVTRVTSNSNRLACFYVIQSNSVRIHAINGTNKYKNQCLCDVSFVLKDFQRFSAKISFCCAFWILLIHIYTFPPKYFALKINIYEFKRANFFVVCV